MKEIKCAGGCGRRALTTLFERVIVGRTACPECRTTKQCDHCGHISEDELPPFATYATGRPLRLCGRCARKEWHR